MRTTATPRSAIRPALRLAVVVCLALGVAACGGDGDGDSTERPGGGDGPRVRVSSKDSPLTYDADRFETQAGDVNIELVNDGALQHTLNIDLDSDDFRLIVNTRGDSDDGTVTLESGTYEIYCDVAGHEDMKADLVVE